MNDKVDPHEMSAIERELGFIERQTKTYHRVKILKGHTWKVRFLPVEQGEEKTFFGRYVFHWINKRPYLCPKTPVSFGGEGEDADCPLCRTAEQLNNDRDQFVSRVGYKAMGVVQWLTYCLVVSREDDSGRLERTREPELYTPWEFWLTRASFSDFGMIWKQYKRGSSGDGPEYSFMDLLDGTNISVKARKNGLRFSPDRPSPIIDANRYDELVNTIWGQIKFPDHKLTSERELNLLARKLEEYAFDGDGGDRDDRDDRNERRAPRRDDDDDDDDDDNDDGNDSGRGRGRQDYDDRERDPRPRNEERRASSPTRAAVAPPPPSRPAAPAPAPRAESSPRPVSAPSIKTPLPPRSAVPKPPAARAVTPPAARVQSSVSDEEDNAPAEAADPAPPVEPEDLPQVEATGASPAPPAAPRSLSDRLRSGIAAASRR